jgi:hypothetical protein
MNKVQRIAIILGSADGVTLAVSVIASLVHKQSSIWNAGFGDGLGELVGMFAGVYLTKDNDAGFWPAVACGIAALAGCVIPCVPFIFATGAAAITMATILAIVVGAVISRLRPEKGIGAVAITYGVIIGAGMLSWLGSFT